jgi:hypothetical protein
MVRLTTAWAIAGIGLAAAARLLAEHFWILSVVPHAVWWLGAVALLGAALWRARAAARRRSALLQAGGMLAAMVAYLPAWWAGVHLTETVRFYWNRPAYDRIVAAVRPPEGVTRLSANGLDYIVDPGPPVRVAFVWPGGIIDNWCGVVHDPSGDVLRVNSLHLWTPEWRNARQTRLFGGDMTSCRTLKQPYHLCCFT